VWYVTTASRTGAWLAEAFAGDSACEVQLEEAHGAAAGFERLREVLFDAVLVSHQPGQLDALAFVDGLRAGGAEEPLLVLGQPSEQEMSALCYEVGADAYICVNTATTRCVLWIVARATERHQLIRENRRLQHAERHRLQFEQHEAERLLSEQRGLARDSQGSCELDSGDSNTAISAGLGDRIARAPDAPQLAEPLRLHYREMLRAHVIMGSGNLAGEMGELAEMLATARATAPQTMRLHVQVLEELVHGLGNRSARHVLSRADLLLLDVLVHLAERYRLHAEEAAPPDPPATAPEH
jgi:DNA-binding NarL/FixJ family response regulator